MVRIQFSWRRGLDYNFVKILCPQNKTDYGHVKIHKDHFLISWGG
jgi:hypothetical protein